MKLGSALAALLVVLLTAASVTGQPTTTPPPLIQPGNPNNPADFVNNPHPVMPWAPNNPDRFLSETYGTAIQYIPVPPQHVAIQVWVPLPDGLPPQTREEAVEVPGYYVTETTTGYWYPERWMLQQLNLGVYRWVKLPAEFRRK